MRIVGFGFSRSAEELLRFVIEFWVVYFNQA